MPLSSNASLSVALIYKTTAGIARVDVRQTTFSNPVTHGNTPRLWRQPTRPSCWRHESDEDADEDVVD